MDELLAEGLEILDSDSIRTTQETFEKSKKAALKATKAAKTHKNFKKIEKKNLADQKAKYGLNQKYKANSKVAGVVFKGKAAEREKRKRKVLQSIKKTETKTDLAKWCKLTGCQYLKPEVESTEPEESAFDDSYFEKFEKEFLQK